MTEEVNYEHIGDDDVVPDNLVAAVENIVNENVGGDSQMLDVNEDMMDMDVNEEQTEEPFAAHESENAMRTLKNRKRAFSSLELFFRKVRQCEKKMLFNEFYLAWLECALIDYRHCWNEDKQMTDGLFQMQDAIPMPMSEMDWEMLDENWEM